MMNFTVPSACIKCGSSNIDIDVLCPDCRRKEYDTKKCGRCKKDYDGRSGWQVPHFGGYIDTIYTCPECKQWYNDEADRSKKRLLELPGEIETLMKHMDEWDAKDNNSVREVDGDYEYLTYDPLTFKEFQDAIEDYKTRRSEILSARTHVEKLEEQIRKLVEEKNECELHQHWGRR